MKETNTKTEKFTPILIAVKEDEKKAFESNCELKRTHLTALFDYMSNFVTIEDKNTYKEDIYGSFLSAFLDKNLSSFPPGINANKLMELMSVSASKLDALINKAKEIDIPFDYNTNEPIETPDFGLYTTSIQQNKLLLFAQKTLKLIQEGNEIGITPYPADIIKAFRGLLFFDWNSNQLKPNAFFIQDNIRSTY